MGGGDVLGLNFQPFSSVWSKQYNAAQSSSVRLSDSVLPHLLAEAHAHRLLHQLDPDLDRMLNRIAPEWTANDLPQLLSCSKNGIVAFDDSWTLFAWSRWWMEVYACDPSVEVVILHVDDHRDLLNPLLAKLQSGLTSRRDRWIDMVTGRWVSLKDAQSIASAILSGAIGIGTFVVPLLHTLRRVEIRHLRVGSEQSVQSSLRPSTVIDDRLLPMATRLSMEEHIISARSPNLSYVYSSTSDVQEWVQGIPNHAKILLHIDLDYFNDRYAGGRKQSRSEAGEREMQADIQSLCNVLEVNGLCGRIENTAVALSPGFCPSLHWEFLLCHLQRGLHAVGCPCP